LFGLASNGRKNTSKKVLIPKRGIYQKNQICLDFKNLKLQFNF